MGLSGFADLLHPLLLADRDLDCPIFARQLEIECCRRRMSQSGDRNGFMRGQCWDIDGSEVAMCLKIRSYTGATGGGKGV